MSNWRLSLADVTLDERIGRGNFGEVYRGTYAGLDVAVKKLYFVDDDFMQKYIEREMDIFTKLHHPHIVQLMGLCIEASDMYIVTEFVKGGDLRSRLKNKDVAMPWELRVKVALEVALAMNYLHTKGLMHRDLKSHNLLVTENWGIKVCDFGLARKEDGGDFMTIVGTNEWMAPEVAMGEKYDKMADVFSFGMVMLELCTREKPPERKLIKGYAFEKEEVEELCDPKMPPAFWKLLCDCAEFEPEKRPDFNKIVERLKEILANMGAGGGESTKSDGSKREKKEHSEKKHKKKHKKEDGDEKKHHKKHREHKERSGGDEKKERNGGEEKKEKKKHHKKE